MINDFTQGNIPKQLITFAIPFMISNAMQVFYAMVDMIVVGRFVGSPGLSAVSIASQVFTFMTMLCLGFSTGGQVYISQLIGSGQKERLNATIGTMFSIIAILGAVMTVLGLLLHRPVLNLLNTPAESFAMATDYMIVCSCGILFTYGYNMISAVLRGMGDSRHPFIFIMIASGINIVLDLLFVGVFKWRVAGAALATILGQAFSFVYAMFYLYRRKTEFGFDFQRRSFAIRGDIAKILFRLGIPFALQSCAINISMMFVNSLVNQFGVAASATFGVGVKLDDVINKITQGVTFAVSAMVGQNIASGNAGRAQQIVHVSWIISLCSYAVAACILWSFPEELFSLFTDDQDVIALAFVFVSAILWHFPAMAIMKGTNGFIQGIGNAGFSLAIALLDGFVFRIVISYLLGVTFGLGLFGFFLGYGLAAYGTSIPGLIYFFSGMWKKRRLYTEKS